MTLPTAAPRLRPTDRLAALLAPYAVIGALVVSRAARALRFGPGIWPV